MTRHWPIELDAPGLDADHPLFDLQTLSAVHHGRARLIVATPDDRTVAAAQAILQEHAPERLDDAAGLPLAVVAHPNLRDWADAARLTRRLAQAGLTWRLRSPETPGWTRAREEGRLRADLLDHDGILAVRWTGTDVGALPLPEVRRFQPTHSEIRALVAELRVALGTLPGDAVSVTVRMDHGGVGLRLLGLPAREPEARQAVWAAIGRVILARAAHATLRVAPVARWEDARLGLDLDLDLLIPASRGHPTADPPAAGVCPPELVATWLIDSDDLRELAAAFPEGAPLDDHTWETSTRPDALSLPVHPGRPRGDAPHDVRAIAWHDGAGWSIRWRHDLLDRDLVEHTTLRLADADDRRAIDRLIGRLQAAGIEPLGSADDRWVQPVADDGGRPGLAIWFPPLAEDWPSLRVAVLPEADEPWIPTVTVGAAPDRTLIHLWRRTEADDDAVRWTPVPPAPSPVRRDTRRP